LSRNDRERARSDLYDEKEFEGLLESARMNAANDWEESFVADMKTRYDQFGRRMYLTSSPA
jgi:hypothetical protein